METSISLRNCQTLLVPRQSRGFSRIMGSEERKYRAVLHFMEPEQVCQGHRVFDVLINGQKVLSQFDIVRETGAPRRALAKEVKSTGACTTVELALEPVSGKAPLICAVEIIQE